MQDFKIKPAPITSPAVRSRFLRSPVQAGPNRPETPKDPMRPQASPAPQGPAPSPVPRPTAAGPARPAPGQQAGAGGLRLAPAPSSVPRSPALANPGMGRDGGQNLPHAAAMAPWQRGGAGPTSSYDLPGGMASAGQGMWRQEFQGGPMGQAPGDPVGDLQRGLMSRNDAALAAANYRASLGQNQNVGAMPVIGQPQNTGGEDPALLGAPAPAPQGDGGYSAAGPRQAGTQAGGQGQPGQQTSQASTGYSGSGMNDYSSYDDFIASGQGKVGDVVRYGSEAWVYLGDSETGDDMWQGPNGEKLPTSETPWGLKQREQFDQNNQDKATERLATDLGLNDDQRKYVDFLLGNGYGVDNASGDIYFNGENTGHTIFDDPSTFSGRLGNDYDTYAKENGIQNNPNAEIEALLKDLPTAPGIDQEMLDKAIGAARRKQALDSSQAMMMAQEQASRARLGAGFQAGVGADLALRSGVEQGNTEAKMRLEASIQDMQSRLADYQNRIANLRLLAQLKAKTAEGAAAIEAQRALMRYAAELQAEIQSANSALAAFGTAGGVIGGLGQLAAGIGSLFVPA